MHKEKKLPADSDPDSSLVQQSCSESDLWRKPRVAPQTEEEVSSLSVKTRERRINSSTSENTEAGLKQRQKRFAP